MDNQAKDLKLEKDVVANEESAKTELENASKKESKLLKKTGSKNCM